MKTMLMVLVAALSLSAQDQELTPRQKDRLAADAAADAKKTIAFISGGLLSGKPVKGAPFSAEAVTETTQVLADGNRIAQKSSSKQYRDSEGRERREETSSMGAVFISDPVAQASYTLHPDTRTAEKAPFFGGYAKLLNLGRDSLSGQGFSISLPLRAKEPPDTLVVSGANGGRVENLPATVMEGVLAQGTRTTTTIPAGQIGNERDINVVYERWYSPDLQLTVMTKLSDPRTGETVYKLTNIVRIEQPLSLFEVPSDYAVSAGALNISTPKLRLRLNPQQ